MKLRIRLDDDCFIGDGHVCKNSLPPDRLNWSIDDVDGAVDGSSRQAISILLSNQPQPQPQSPSSPLVNLILVILLRSCSTLLEKVPSLMLKIPPHLSHASQATKSIAHLKKSNREKRIEERNKSIWQLLDFNRVESFSPKKSYQRITPSLNVIHISRDPKSKWPYYEREKRAQLNLYQHFQLVKVVHYYSKMKFKLNSILELLFLLIFIMCLYFSPKYEYHSNRDSLNLQASRVSFVDALNLVDLAPLNHANKQGNNLHQHIQKLSTHIRSNRQESSSDWEASQTEANLSPTTSSNRSLQLHTPDFSDSYSPKLDNPNEESEIDAKFSELENLPSTKADSTTYDNTSLSGIDSSNSTTLDNYVTEPPTLMESLFSHIDKQWKFAEVILIIVISAILNLVTIIGNIMVLISFKMDRSLQTVSNYFLLSLALADLLIGLISMPLYTLYLLLNYWPLGALMCDIWLAIDYLNSNAAVLNMLIISFDRYFSVTRPLTYRAKRTTKHACLMISCAWILSLTIWTPAIFTYPYFKGRTVQGTDKCEIEFVKANTYLTFVTAILAFYIPVAIMIYLYWRIWLETKKRYRDLTTLFLVSGVGAAAPVRVTRPPLLSSGNNNNNNNSSNNKQVVASQPQQKQTPSALKRQIGACEQQSKDPAKASNRYSRPNSIITEKTQVADVNSHQRDEMMQKEQEQQQQVVPYLGGLISSSTLHTAQTNGNILCEQLKYSEQEGSWQKGRKCRCLCCPRILKLKSKSSTKCPYRIMGNTTTDCVKCAAIYANQATIRIECQICKATDINKEAQPLKTRNQTTELALIEQGARSDKLQHSKRSPHRHHHHHHHHHHGHQHGHHHVHHAHHHHHPNKQANINTDHEQANSKTENLHQNLHQHHTQRNHHHHRHHHHHHRHHQHRSQQHQSKQQQQYLEHHATSHRRRISGCVRGEANGYLRDCKPQNCKLSILTSGYQLLNGNKSRCCASILRKVHPSAKYHCTEQNANIVDNQQQQLHSNQTNINNGDNNKRTSISCISLSSTNPVSKELPLGEADPEEITSTNNKEITMVDTASSPIQFPLSIPKALGSEHDDDDEEEDDDEEDDDDDNDEERDFETRIVSAGDKFRFESENLRAESFSPVLKTSPSKLKETSALMHPVRNKSNCRKCCKSESRCSNKVKVYSTRCSLCIPAKRQHSIDYQNSFTITRSPECKLCQKLLNSTRLSPTTNKPVADKDIKPDLNIKEKREALEGETTAIDCVNNTRLPILGALRKAPEEIQPRQADETKSRPFNQSSSSSLHYSSSNLQNKDKLKKAGKKFSQKLTFSDILVSPDKDSSVKRFSGGTIRQHSSNTSSTDSTSNRKSFNTNGHEAVDKKSWLSRLFRVTLNEDIDVSESGEQGQKSPRAVQLFRAIQCCKGAYSSKAKRLSSNDSSSHKNSSSDDSETTTTNHNNTQANHLNSTSSKMSYSSHHPIQPKSERKAAKTLSTLLLVFIVTWLPYNILVLIKTLSGVEDQVPERIWNFSYYLCYINSTINPLCYALCNAQFRRTYMRILKCKLSNEHNSTRRLVPLQSSSNWNKDLRLNTDSTDSNFRHNSQQLLHHRT